MNHSFDCITDKSILVTGGAGFLGSHLIDKILECDFKHTNSNVISLDNEFRGSFSKNLEDSSKKYSNFLKIKGDVRNYDDFKKCTENNDEIGSIFHLAAINGTRFFYSIPETVLDVNIRGLINALEFARKNDVDHFVFASTPEAYGIPRVFPTPETEPLIVPDIENPRWSYGGSKIIGEIYCSVYSKKYGLKCSILRYHNIYGPRDTYGHVIPDLAYQLFQGKKEIKIQGTGNETRSFCYVSDAIDATSYIIEKQKNNLDIFNVGIDKETTIATLFEMIKKIHSNKKSSNNKIVNKNQNIENNEQIISLFSGDTKGGTHRRIPDISKLNNLGFTPKVSLSDGLTKTYQWMIDNPDYYRQNLEK